MGLVWIVPVMGIIAVLFSGYLAFDVLKRDPGTSEMQRVAGTIFEGAMAFLRRQYLTIAQLSIVVAIIIGLIVGFTANTVYDPVNQGGGAVSATQQGILAGIAFLVGAACSGLSGFIGMYISVRSNLRTAAAAQKNLREAITVALGGLW